jgi:DnaJ homolog subfamily A member 5
MASLSNEEATGRKRTCLYELLQVPRDVAPAQLKKAYYLVARVHHPDKKGNTKEATAYFQEIQHAYEILSDKNERAWYDSHREEILRGGTGGGADDGDSFADELDINKFPTPGPFFTGNFYKVFGDMFREIDSFEKKAYDRAGEEKKYNPAPLFGDENSSGNDVLSFYQWWSGFTTKQTFAWRDKYNITQAENRRIRRAMEKENAKIRGNHRTSYAFNVRRILSSVRYNDKRYEKILKQEEEKKEQAKIARLEEQERIKEENALKKERWLEEREKEARELQQARDAGLLSDEEIEFRLDEDDDYYGNKKDNKKRGKKKKKKKKKKKNDSNNNDNGTNGAETGLRNISNNVEDISLNKEDIDVTTNNSVNAIQGDNGLGKPAVTEKEKEEEEEEEEEIGEIPEKMECKVCKKKFKSHGMYKTHERSKKHIQKMKKLGFA